jgi:hypothetical protein
MARRYAGMTLVEADQLRQGWCMHVVLLCIQKLKAAGGNGVG